MAVPKFFEFFEAFLHVLEDGELHTTKESDVHYKGDKWKQRKKNYWKTFAKEIEDGNIDLKAQ